MIYRFTNDYSEGAHENILKALVDTNLNQEIGYGEDSFCDEAKKLIKAKIKNKDAHIHFVSGGTQANLIIISSVLRPHEAVIAASTGHINIHETGAIEATGHKICTIESEDGKLTVEHIKKVLDSHTDEHMVKPKMVFISNTTELGTIYKKEELQEISKFCRENNLYLHLDGARLGSALTSRDNDLTLEELSSLVDIFYIGGTKNGALLGEAIVINNDKLKEDFRYHIKQKGAMVAKGRILGIQFVELFKNNLYFDLANHANKMAYKLSDSLKELGYEFLTEPTSNQIFPIMTNEEIDKLKEDYGFNIERKIDNNKKAIRLVSSWATREDAVDEFIDYMKKLGSVKVC